MTEERIINPTYVLVGDFEIISSAEGFTLSETDSVTGRYQSIRSITFRSQTLAWDIARLLSLSFADGTSSASVGFRLGDLAYAEVIGGKSGSCQLFRWDEERQKQEEEPFLIAQSCAELEEGLLEFLRENSGIMNT